MFVSLTFTISLTLILANSHFLRRTISRYRFALEVDHPRELVRSTEPATPPHHKRERDIEIQRERETDRKRQRETERKREREREREIERRSKERERTRERNTERRRKEREREREMRWTAFCLDASTVHGGGRIVLAKLR